MKNSLHNLRLKATTASVIFAGASLVAASAAIAKATDARPPQGWEVRLITGADFNQVDKISANFASSAGKVNIDMDTGMLFGGAVAYNWLNGWTAELEYTWRRTEMSAPPAALFPDATEGDIASVLIFANFFYRPQIASMPRLQPRFGVGAGLLQEVSSDFETNGVEESFDGNGAAFQLIIGTDYLLTDNWTLGVDLKYYSSSSVTLKGETDSSRELKLDYSGFSLNLSAAYRF